MCILNMYFIPQTLFACLITSVDEKLRCFILSFVLTGKVCDAFDTSAYPPRPPTQNLTWLFRGWVDGAERCFLSDWQVSRQFDGEFCIWRRLIPVISVTGSGTLSLPTPLMFMCLTCWVLLLVLHWLSLDISKQMWGFSVPSSVAVNSSDLWE